MVLSRTRLGDRGHKVVLKVFRTSSVCYQGLIRDTCFNHQITNLLENVTRSRISIRLTTRPHGTQNATGAFVVMANKSIVILSKNTLSYSLPVLVLL